MGFLLKKTDYDSNLINTIRLIRTENIGPKSFFKLVKHFGNTKTAIENLGNYSVRGGRKTPLRAASLDDAYKELEAHSKYGAKMISFQDAAYPKYLLNTPAPPPVISCKGNLNLLNKKSVAIVGARNASVNGMEFARQISRELSEQYGYIIISGMARGIDKAVHEVSLKHTVAVLAGGIDHIYPSENTKLYENIASNGLIVAELPFGTLPMSQNFPQRNRIIAGMSLGVIVVEASVNSGSLITAKFGLDYNRDIFAVPGLPMDPRSKGVNKLIKEGAILIENTEDIISNISQVEEQINRERVNEDGDEYKNIQHEVTDTQRQDIIGLLSYNPVDINLIIASTEVPLPVIQIVLIELELAGRLVRMHGNKIALKYSENT